VDLLPGGNMSFRREWVEAVGGFDPGYVGTNHREDPDFCLRVGRRGGCFRYPPAAHVPHLDSRRPLGELKPWHEFWLRYSFARNDAYFVIKHFGRRPRAVWRILVSDTFQFMRRAFTSRSLTIIATIPVFLTARGAGAAAGYWHRLKLACGWRPDYLRGLEPRPVAAPAAAASVRDHDGARV